MPDIKTGIYNGSGKELKDPEDRYGTFIENSVCGIYLVQNEKIIFANEAFASIHGYLKDDILGLDSLETVYPMDRHRAEDIRNKRLQGKETSTEYEIRGIKRNGDMIWLQQRNVLVERNGKPAILGYEVDITEYKEKENALRESYEVLETLFSSAHFLIAYMDKDSNFIRVNRAFAEADGRSPDFFTGKNFFDLYPNAENENIFRIVAATGQPLFIYGKPFEYPLHPERGVSYWDWGLQPTGVSEAGVKGIVLSLINVTECKKDAEALKQAHAELERRAGELKQRAAQLARLGSELTLAEQRERDRIAGILHDHLQQLMVGARMGLEILIRDLDNAMKPEARRILDLIDRSIGASRRLTAELKPPMLESKDISDYLEWLARWMLKTHDLEVTLQDRIPVIVNQSDIIILLFFSVRELLFNALKHAGIKSATIKTEIQDNGELRITVMDDGAGFDPELVWKNAGADQKSGLITIRERLMHAGGRLEVESAPHKGSAISLVVPLGVERPSEKELPERTG